MAYLASLFRHCKVAVFVALLLHGTSKLAAESAIRVDSERLREYADRKGLFEIVAPCVLVCEKENVEFIGLATHASHASERSISSVE